MLQGSQERIGRLQEDAVGLYLGWPLGGDEYSMKATVASAGGLAVASTLAGASCLEHLILQEPSHHV